MNYDKLNEKGFLIEEFDLEKMPKIFIQKGYKDTSLIYRSSVPINIKEIYDIQGFETNKIKVRSERTSIIGDIFCNTIKPNLTKSWFFSIYEKIINGKIQILRNNKDDIHLILTIKKEDIINIQNNSITRKFIINDFKKEKLEKKIKQKENNLYNCRLFGEIKKKSLNILFEFSNSDQYGNVVINI